MTIEYITSKNLYLLIRDTLKLLNEEVINHGIRVSYLMSQMMECDGNYEKYEIADFMLLGMMHDIGAFKTDDVKKTLSYEAKRTLPHSIYGYMFLKYLSPLEKQSKMLLYHHVDTLKMRGMDYEYLKETELLKVAEIIEIWRKAFGDKFDYKQIERYRDTKFSGDAIDLLYAAIKENDVLTKLDSGEYLEEFEESMDYLLLSDDEKDKYVRLMMYCTGLRDEDLVSNTIMTICVSRELGIRLRMNEMERNELYYASLLHDIGMLGLPYDFINSSQKLKTEEMNLVKTHVEIMEKILEGRVTEPILNIAATHHERFDGSGYPRGLKGGSLTQKDAILQISETVVNMSIRKNYREAFSKEEILKELNDGIISGKYEGIAADTMVKFYDDIMQKAHEKAKITLLTHQKLKFNTEKVYKNFMAIEGIKD